MGGDCNCDGRTGVRWPRYWDRPSTGKEEAIGIQSGGEAGTKMHRHGGRASAEYADHVVLERLDGLLDKVAAMVVGGEKFVYHLGEFDFGFVCKQCLVFEYLVPWDDAASGHSRKCATSGKN